MEAYKLTSSKATENLDMAVVARFIRQKKIYLNAELIASVEEFEMLWGSIKKNQILLKDEETGNARRLQDVFSESRAHGFISRPKLSR